MTTATAAMMIFLLLEKKISVLETASATEVFFSVFSLDIS